MIRAVLDTNIMISSIFWRGNPYRVMTRGFKEDYVMVTSLDILKELAEKLEYRFEVPRDKIKDLLGLIITPSYIVEPIRKLNVVKADESDNKIIECAVEGHADYIVTGDGHLLDIGECEGVKIITAARMMEILGKVKE